jgi:hypothetical protein
LDPFNPAQVRVYPRDLCYLVVFEGRVSTNFPYFQRCQPLSPEKHMSIMVSVIPRSFSMPSPSAKQELQLNEVSTCWLQCPLQALINHCPPQVGQSRRCCGAFCKVFFDILSSWFLMHTTVTRLVSQTGRSVRLHCSIPMWSSPSDTCELVLVTGESRSYS